MWCATAVMTSITSSQGGRKFYEVPKDPSGRVPSQGPQEGADDPSQLASYVRGQILGRDTGFEGPFGKRRITYCDYVASGRSLKFVEDYLMEQVLPHYGNTHTTTSVTSTQTTLFRHEARDIVRCVPKQ